MAQASTYLIFYLLIKFSCRQYESAPWQDIVVMDFGSVKNSKIYMNKDCKDHFLSIKNIAYDLALYPMSV